MKKMLIVLALLAVTAYLETPDDHYWGAVDTHGSIHLKQDTDYDESTIKNNDLCFDHSEDMLECSLANAIKSS